MTRWKRRRESNTNYADLVSQITADGFLSKEEYEEFTEAVMEDGKVDDIESEQIRRIMKMIKDGKVRVADDIDALKK